MLTFIVIETNSKEASRVINRLDNIRFSVTDDLKRFVEEKYDVDVMEREGNGEEFVYMARNEEDGNEWQEMNSVGKVDMLINVPTFHSTPLNFAPDTIQCHQCGESIQMDGPRRHCHKSARSHALRHTSLKSFECPVENCGHQTRNKFNMESHLMHQHNVRDVYAGKIWWSHAEKKELRDMQTLCFPELYPPRARFQCQICQKVINGKYEHYLEGRRRHAVIHTNIMIYKCIEKGCHFETQYDYMMYKHSRFMHQKALNINMSRIELSEEELLEIEGALQKCFPEVVDNFDES